MRRYDSQECMEMKAAIEAPLAINSLTVTLLVVPASLMTFRLQSTRNIGLPTNFVECVTF